jgi:hypothetical protein
MIKKDDRTEEQKLTHTLAVVARDKFLSGWGGARGGTSRCAWAYDIKAIGEKGADRLFNWVKNRSEMRGVNIARINLYKAPARTAHFHIYVADADHVGVREGGSK